MNAIVIGGGPAAVGAAVALRCEGLPTAIVGDQFEPRCSISPRLENIPGAGPLSGRVYAQRLMQQLQDFGADIIREKATKLSRNAAGDIEVMLKAKTISAPIVVLATGLMLEHTSSVQPDINRPSIVVYGPGDAAAQMALGHANASIVKHVTLVVPAPDLDRCSSYLRDRIRGNRHIEVLYNCEAKLTREFEVLISRKDTKADVVLLRHASLQVLLGSFPTTAPFAGFVSCDQRGFVKNLHGSHPFQTNQPGVFVAGDVRLGSTKRVAVAQGEGVAAGHAAALWLRAQKGAL